MGCKSVKYGKDHKYGLNLSSNSILEESQGEYKEEKLWVSPSQQAWSIRHSLNPAPLAMWFDGTCPSPASQTRRASAGAWIGTSAHHSINTAYHMLPHYWSRLWFKGRTSDESRGRVYVKNLFIYASVTKREFMIALNCSHSTVTADTAVFSSHLSNSILFLAISTLLFQWNTFYHIALLPLLIYLII